MTSPHFSDNAVRSRFELVEGGHIAFARYTRAGDTLTIPYVEAPPELRGTGAAGRLMTDLAEHARAHALKVVPVCGYAVAWFRKHPQYKDVLA